MLRCRLYGLTQQVGNWLLSSTPILMLDLIFKTSSCALAAGVVTKNQYNLLEKGVIAVLFGITKGNFQAQGLKCQGKNELRSRRSYSRRSG